MAMHFLKKIACGTAVFLCFLSIGNTSMSFDYQPTGTFHSEEVNIPSMDATDLLGSPLISPSTAQPENVEGLTPEKVLRPIPSKAREVVAGWSGARHHKKLTANGQRFNMNKNTLAHRTLPFGTKVRLVTLDNRKSAEGVVNDRGPYCKGRDLDVSYSMAKQLGFVRKGVVKLYLSQLEDQDLHN
jgi:rare lipoprotein A (peptidoglycan hydrolase)